MENALITWLFNFAPLLAIAVFMAWAIWRLGTLSGIYETRFARIESDISELKVEVKEIKVDLTKLDNRLGRVEAQLEIVIHLLKEKKVI